jgi:hypothetical protein
VMEKLAAGRGPQGLGFSHAMMDALDGKGDINAVAQQLLSLPEGQGNPGSLSPLGGYDALYWFIAIRRNDLAVERFARIERELPYIARTFAFDPHFAVLHCEPKFIDILRELKVEEPYLAAPCKAAH